MAWRLHELCKFSSGQHLHECNLSLCPCLHWSSHQDETPSPHHYHESRRSHSSLLRLCLKTAWTVRILRLWSWHPVHLWERLNAIMKYYLQAFINYMQDDWAKWIPGAEFMANNAPSVTTLASPFLANSGQNPHLRFKPSEPLATDLTAQQQIKLLDIENFTKKMEDLTEHLRVEMLIVQAVYEFSANRSRCPYPHYFVEDEVWLNAKNLNITRSAVKLNNHHVRPFKVKRIFEKNSLVIELKLLNSWRFILCFTSPFWAMWLLTLSLVNIKNPENSSLLRTVSEPDMLPEYLTPRWINVSIHRYSSTMSNEKVISLPGNPSIWWIIASKLLMNITPRILSLKDPTFILVSFQHVNVMAPS